MTAGRFVVLRSFQIRPGAVAERDTVVELTNADQIETLLQANKIEPADKATESRIRRTSTAQWTAVEPRERGPGWVSNW